MSKHTPGPWAISRGAQEHPLAIEGPSQTVAMVRHAKASGLAGHLETHDNATLIAAAPDLLEACKVMMDNLDQFTKRDIYALGLEHACETMVEAIAKAEGR